MTPTQKTALNALLDAATPVLRIGGVDVESWCRPMQSSNDPRYGPWSYRAQFTVLHQEAWSREGEVIYFVQDGQSRLRLVGQSKDRLKTRWRESPMHSPTTHAPLGKKALFHSSTWPAIEKALKAGERAPFTISALFRDQLESTCRTVGGELSGALQLQETHLHRLAYHVESWVCSLEHDAGPLWNKAKVAA